MRDGSHPLWYAGFKLTVFVLLVANTAVFAAQGTLSEGLDSLAWFTLLVLFELETAHAGWLAARRAVTVVHVLRLLAGGAVLAAAIGYLLDQAWLDATNAWLWIAVVILLEVEVRCAESVRRHRGWFVGTAVTLYTCLAGAAVVWAWRGEWFDAYDAALWLVAFATIEMNLLAQFADSSAHAPPAPV